MRKRVAFTAIFDRRGRNVYSLNDRAAERSPTRRRLRPRRKKAVGNRRSAISERAEAEAES